MKIEIIEIIKTLDQAELRTLERLAAGFVDPGDAAAAQLVFEAENTLYNLWQYLADLKQNDYRLWRLTQTAAAAVWTGLIEPGDATAVKLIVRLLPALAISAVSSDENAKTLYRSVYDSVECEDAQEVRLATFTRGLEVWRNRIAQHGVGKTLRQCLLIAQVNKLCFLTWHHELYPSQLTDLGVNQPIGIWVRGNAEILSRAAVAVVGSRCSSDYGNRVTEDLAAELIRCGKLLVSGGAYGIDYIAHRTALQHASPTIAVLAGGADRYYPQSHEQMFRAIVEQGGAIVSELAPGAAPTRWRFLQRNRLIAAISEGVLITEAGARSGSINTAGHAASIGRIVAAVPGNIDSANATGCHKLIREYGAELISGMDVLREVFDLSEDSQTGDSAAEARELSTHTRVLDSLSRRNYYDIAKVSALSGLSREECVLALAELVLLGKAKQEYKNETVVWKLIT
ncbi:DNA-processing protein DprA [Canibacter sp. lx-72]|uniref:DNA-processing protein DprA n=1 Tax=Canibacter zhuwentaonis TaxID=2837491 RepID=UPI001BDCE811|nr:DNA-processing protein DprA [Canibacter zhuwentaonis]MBT1017675.1 DNA-processing protein DprA [Canibacter zhuwentaonis]